MAKQWGRGRAVVTIDLPNHGGSPWIEAMAYPGLAEAVRETISEIGLDRPVVLGHSLGGKVAMTMALSWPEWLSGLVILDIAPVRYAHGFESHISAMQAVPLDRLNRRAEAEALLAERGLPPAVCSFLCQNLVPEAGGGWRWRVPLDAIAAAMPTITGFPTYEAGAVYRGPSLLIKGGDSEYVSDDHEHVIKALFPAVELVAIEGAGHWVHADRPTRVIEEVEAFCRQVDPADHEARTHLRHET